MTDHFEHREYYGDVYDDPTDADQYDTEPVHSHASVGHYVEEVADVYPYEGHYPTATDRRFT